MKITDAITTIKEATKSAWFALIVFLLGCLPLFNKFVKKAVEYKSLYEKWPFLPAILLAMTIVGFVLLLMHASGWVNSKWVQPALDNARANKKAAQNEEQLRIGREWIQQNHDYQDWTLIRKVVSSENMVGYIVSAYDQRSLNRLTQMQVLVPVEFHPGYYGINDQIWDVLQPLLDSRFMEMDEQERKEKLKARQNGWR